MSENKSDKMYIRKTGYERRCRLKEKAKRKGKREKRKEKRRKRSNKREERKIRKSISVHLETPVKNKSFALKNDNL